MKNIFDLAAFCLQHDNLEEKLSTTHQAWMLKEKGLLDYSCSDLPLPISSTRFPTRPELRDPRLMPRRKLTTEAGKIAFFHAIAHIEFMAIYLAWDIIYRFRGLPEQFYQDWLRVAGEEAQHFSLLQTRLRQFHVNYGDLPAHSGLWDVAEDSADDLLARLALVPRYMEAHGLDVTPAMIKKFESLGDRQSVEILKRILDDEVGHVKLGSYWFKTFCEQRDIDPESHYKELISTRLKGNPHGKLNRPMRKKAGFSDAELDWLENGYRGRESI